MDQFMNLLSGFVSAHPYWTIGIGVGWFFISLVASSLPSPSQSSGTGYKFLFTFMHSLSGALGRIFPFLRMPGDPSRGSQTFFGKSGDQTPPPPAP